MCITRSERTSRRYGSLLFIGTDVNILYAVDLTTGATAWSASLGPQGQQTESTFVTAPVVLGGAVYAGTAYPVGQGAWNWAYLVALSAASGAPLGSYDVHDYYEDTLLEQYRIDNASDNGFALNGPLIVSVAYNQILFGYNDVLIAVAASPQSWSTGAVTWTAPALTPIVDINVSNITIGSETFSGELLYVFDDSNGSASIAAVNPGTGAVVIAAQQLPTATSVFAQGVYTSSSAFYVATDGALCIVPYSLQGITTDSVSGLVLLASDAISGINYAASVSSSTSFPVDVEILAIQVENLLSQFYIEAAFQEDWPASGGTYTRGCSYQFLVTVLDSNQLPLPAEAVKIWSQPYPDGSSVTATVNGVACVLDADASYATVTTATGDIEVVIPSGTMTAPPLHLWAAFMTPGESIVIWPQQPVQALTNIAGGTITQSNNSLGTQLLAATNYSGSKILPGNYQNSASADAIGYCLQNVLQAPTAAAAAWEPPQYTASFQKYEGVQYLPSDQVLPSPQGNLDASALAGMQLSIDGNGNASFGASANANATASAAFHLGQDSLGSDLGDLLHDIRNGVDEVWKDFTATFSKVEGEVENAIQAVINVTINGTEAVYCGVVQTIDDIGTVVLAVFKAIGAALEDLFEWIVQLLENLFAWLEIFAVQGWIKSCVDSGLSTAEAMFSSIAQDTTSVTNAAQSMLTKFGSEYENVIGKYLPQLPLGSLGASSISNLPSLNRIQSNWLFRRIMGLLDDLSAGSVPSFSTLIPALSTLQGGAQAQIGSQGASTLQQLQTTIVDLVSSTSLLSMNPLDLFTTLNDAVKLLIQVASAVVQDLAAAVSTIFSDLDSYLDSSFPIPLLSAIAELFHIEISFSILDMACMMVAFSAQIITTARRGSGLTSSDLPSVAFNQSWIPGQSDVAAGQRTPAPAIPSNSAAGEGLLYTYAVAGLIFVVVDAFDDVSDGSLFASKAGAALYIGSETVLAGLTVAAMFVGGAGSTTDFVCNASSAGLKFLGLGLDCYTAYDIQNNPDDQSESPTWRDWYSCGLSLVQMILTIIPPCVDQPEPTAEVISSNGFAVASNLPFIAKPLAYYPDTDAVLIGLDAFCGLTYYIDVIDTA
ncbi:MAG TPA: hypothetical protein VEO54_27050 [Thermoanaerobaculia bacterium]|nr:hypothetical protein [Thermoanaerobaculia bacterium]